MKDLTLGRVSRPVKAQCMQLLEHMQEAMTDACANKARYYFGQSVLALQYALGYASKKFRCSSTRSERISTTSLARFDIMFLRTEATFR